MELRGLGEENLRLQWSGKQTRGLVTRHRLGNSTPLTVNPLTIFYDTYIYRPVLCDMSRNQQRDIRGRFSKSSKNTRTVQKSKPTDMAGEKRPRHSGLDGSENVSPSISPSRKKSLADDTASWRDSPEVTNDFYPQYLRRALSPAPKSPAQKLMGIPEAEQSQSSGLETPNRRSLGATDDSRSPFQHQPGSEKTSFISKIHDRSEYNISSSITERVHGEESLNDVSSQSQELQTSGAYAKSGNLSPPQDNQIIGLLPRGLAGNNNIMVLANSKGLPINTVDLENVMSRVMSQVMVKLDHLTTDIKQVPVIKAATAKLDREMIQVRQDCHGIKEKVQDLSRKEEENSANHEALVKEVKDLRSRLDKNSTPDKTKSAPGNGKRFSEMEQLQMEAESRKNNLIIEGIQESEEQSVTDLTTEIQVKSFFTDTLRLPKFELKSAFRLGKPRSGSARPRPIKVQFLLPNQREWVWRAKAVLAKTGDSTFGIKEDLPPKLRAQMAALIRVSQIARNYPDLYHNVRIQDFHIYINGQSYAVLPTGVSPIKAQTFCLFYPWEYSCGCLLWERLEILQSL